MCLSEGRRDKVDEYSSNINDEYCMNHNSAKSKRQYNLVQKSYDINAEFTEGDGFFIEKVVAQEENNRLKKAFEDLNGFMFGW